ncbi:fused MFS/spermidine synthase [Bdellovibrio sp. HCB209]|uniref:fused MFS/spermidine synthase n=1 Tax=Bdellovibrio sp. HCB209 TaxID=3394354 RepID=UPI0039B4316A
MVAMFLTGFSGLLYQILWIRLFSSLLGGTTLSISCVIAHFMLGLGLGTASASWFLRRDTKKQIPLYTYCEIAIVLVIGLGAVFLFGAREELSQILKFSPFPKLLSHFLISGLFIFPATFCMGLSYPFMSYKFSSSKDHQWLYAANCLGGAVGALCSYLVLIYNFGLSGTLYFGFFLNILAAALFVKEKYSFASVHEKQNDVATGVGGELSKSLRIWALLLSALSGFFVLSLEQIWFRLAGLFLGGRVYVHSLVLSVLLLTLAIAAFISPKLSKLSTDVQIKAVLFIIRLTGVFAVLGFIVLPIAVSSGIDLVRPYAKTIQGVYLLVLLLVAVLPGVLLGVCFPLSLKVIQAGAESALQRTRNLSMAVYVNTFASVLGSMLTTYLLFSWLGTVGSLKLLFISLLVLGLVGSWMFLKGSSRYSAVVVSILLVFLLGTKNVSLNPAESALFQAEDEFGYLNVIPLKPKENVTTDRWAMFHNYTSLVAAYGYGETAIVQKNLALFPSLFAKQLDEVLVVGMGYGLTTEAFTQIPEIKKITSIEILPLVIEAQSKLSFKNTAYLKDPRVENIADDGRSFIALSKKSWDVITVNVDPYGAGTTFLMSQEFYQIARKHLNPGGIYAQLLFGAGRDLSSLLKTAREAFPFYRIMPGYTSDGVIFIGSETPLPEWDSVVYDKVKPLLPSKTWYDWVLDTPQTFMNAEATAQAWSDELMQHEGASAKIVTDNNLLIETSRTSFTDLFLTYPKDY